MNVVSRGARNAFRNYIRTLSIVIIIGLSIGLGLSMLVARQAVSAKISSVNASVGTDITVSPAGVRGFEGGGNPLTQAQLAPIESINHVASMSESLNDRLTSSNTNLVSSIDLGALGQRFAQSSGASAAPQGDSFGGAGGSSLNFTPPVTVDGTTDPTNLSNTTGGGTFKLTSGSVFSSTSNDNVAILGTSLASKNNLKVGSTFTAYGTTITVSGIFDSGNSFSNSQMIMPLTTVQRISSQTGQITSAVVQVDSLANVPTVTNEISKQLGSSADVTNQIQQAEATVTPLKNIQTITLYSLIGSLVAGAVIIFLIMIMIVRERRREIGVLKAIGASNVKVMLQFMSEAITLTLLGAIIGIVIGVAAASPITKLLVTNSSSSTTTTQVQGFRGRTAGAGGGAPNISANGGHLRAGGNSFSNIQAVVGWTIIVDGIAAAIIIAVIGSAAASILIAKVRPAEVMRTE
ncbi:MAG TPA: FtsX-like permease family protein [Candidatus Saccharimonadales bacterium]